MDNRYYQDLSGIEVMNQEQLLAEIDNFNRGDIRALDRIIKGNLRLVVHIAKKYSKLLEGNDILEINDLISEGNIGLIKAVKEYKKEKNIDFAVYAFIWIKKYITQLLNNHLKTIRVPKTAKKNVTVTKVESDFSQLVNSDDEEPEIFENVRMALKSLNERERKIIQEYFGIDFEKRTLSAIGEDLGIGKERVKQIKNVALKKIILCLRKTLKNDNRN